jgi:putative Ca2+/H+ antiporter (TMEM165/GDT1 family)
MEVEDMNLIQRAQSAHRHETVIRMVMIVAIIVGALKLVAVVAYATLVSHVQPRWSELTIGAAALGFGVWVMWRSGKQIAEARALLADTPLALVLDLIRLRQRELESWLGKRSLIATGVLAAVAGAIGAAQLERALSAGESTGAAWASLGFVTLALFVLTAIGRKRVRYLRRELVALREMQQQLHGHDRE